MNQCLTQTLQQRAAFVHLVGQQAFDEQHAVRGGDSHKNERYEQGRRRVENVAFQYVLRTESPDRGDDPDEQWRDYADNRAEGKN